MKTDIYWNLFLELRKEVISSQEIRSKIIGFKITFLSASIGLIYANMERVDSNLLLIPAFASFFFDLLINSYSISIKRIGFYCQYYLEPVFNYLSDKPTDFIFWEEYVNQKPIRQKFSMIGNLGLTFIMVVLSAYNALITLSAHLSLFIITILVLTFMIDLYSHLYPRKKLKKLKKPEISFADKDIDEL